ncbi:hypothetical protein J7J08_12775 [Stenotrophomonas sp. ISL-67]|uniref:hypothetical protein n=1 Tax=Stenotrophomonas sp. ISL-67 TaxID=2819171 RepID=UPI001BEB3EBA|nr:hypothetical protein [Stenotrophomonas sp. ISL-67]MBT2768513.1 hypothetical protein [Stenotrophomonas sp. ISL-67]
MPLEAPTATHRPVATTRPWVAIYMARQGAVLHEDDTLPTYDQVLGQNAAPPPYVEVAGQSTAVRRLPGPRAVPQQVANEPGASPSYSYASTAPEHPQVQTRELHMLLKRIERNERKRDAAYDTMLEEFVNRYTRGQVLRNFCGSGLFDDGASTDTCVAERNYQHYVKKVPKLQRDYAALLRRT